VYLNSLDYHDPLYESRSSSTPNLAGRKCLPSRKFRLRSRGQGSAGACTPTALNRADLLQRQENILRPPGVCRNIPGLEFAGEVAELGPRATYWEKGDRVFGLTPAAPTRNMWCRRGPPRRHSGGMDWITAAAISEVFYHAYDALIPASSHQGWAIKFSSTPSAAASDSLGADRARIRRGPYVHLAHARQDRSCNNMASKPGCVVDEKLSQLEAFGQFIR